MFRLMGNCISCIRKKHEAKRPITIAILGLDNAGKTTITKGLSGDPVDLNTAPTVGFSFEKFPFENYDITLYDLGGGKKIRGIWKNYLHEIYGMVYVIDSSASDRMEEAHDNLKEILGNPYISGKPLLLLANKQDKEETLDEVDICEQLTLDNIVTANKCPCRIETCSAIRGSGKKMDKNIKNGMKWMISVIEKHFHELKTRIEFDVKEEEEKRRIEKEERKKRVAERRRERELEEEADRKRLGIEDKVSDEDNPVNGDPFKKLDVNDLKKRDQKLKEEKRKKKELLQKFEEEEKAAESQTKQDLDILSTPRTARSLGSLPSSHLPTTNDFSSPRSSANPLLPPLQKPLGTKFVDEPVKRKKKKKSKPVLVEADEEVDQNAETVGMKSMGTLSNIEVSEKALNSSRSQKSHDASYNNSQWEQVGDGDTQPEDNQPKKVLRKKKKKKPAYVVSDSDEDDTEKEKESQPRKLPPFIQVIPPSISETFEDNVTPPSSHRRKKKNRYLKKRAGTSDEDLTPKHSARQNSFVKSVREYNRSPKDQDTGENSDEENKGHTRQTGILSTNKWGLADDLPEVSEEPRRLQANFNDDIVS